ncbi:MAG TPA: VWA domain-containing protein [Kofleriaceae bacterium]|jgi:hypothetical protein
MSLLGPIALGTWSYLAIGAALLAVSAYIIKMRRRRFEVPFSQLWKRVLDQKDANALWKQLKRLVSLLFVLAILGLVLFAALDPTLGAVDRKARSVVILLDASASMKATDGDDKGQTRIDAAKAKAKRLVDGMGGGDLAMIVRVDGQATPMSRFTSDAPMLDKIIDGVAASDTPADLPRALGAAADALRDRPNPLIVIVSDGAFPATQLGQVTWQPDPKNLPAANPANAGRAASPEAMLSTIDLSNIDVRFLSVGKRSDNVGIVAFNVRRYIANKAAYEVYIEIENFGQEPTHRKLTLYNGTTAVDTRTLDLAPGQKLRQIYPKIPGGEDNRLSATIVPIDAATTDPFGLDDSVYALLPSRKKQKVLMVTSDNLFLEGALLVYDNIEPFKVSPAEYAAKPSLADGMDVVVFDDYTPDNLPPPPASLIFFHPTGPNSPIAVRAGADVTNPRITELDEQHPVMRWVSMSDVYMDKSEAFTPDIKKGEITLAYSVTDSIIAAKRDGKRKIVAFGFSLPSSGRDGATDLPMRVAFPMLLVNALDWFAGDQADLLTTYATGQRERVPLDGAVGATEAIVSDPDGTTTKTPVIDGLATFYPMHVGYYSLTPLGSDGKPLPGITLAANLASPSESNITPSSKLTLGGKQLAEPEAFAITHSQKLWIYLVLLALGFIVLEWITYHRRITV